MPIFEPYSRLFICLSLLFAMLLVQESQGQSWRAFQNKHIDYPEPHSVNLNAYCNLLMVQRNLNPTFCKPRNTFINDSPNNIVQVCQGKAIPWKEFYNSTSNFNMIDCHRTGGTPPNDCQYKGIALFKGICVACQDGQPVHLEALYPSSGSGKPRENGALLYLIFFCSLAICWPFRLL